MDFLDNLLNDMKPEKLAKIIIIVGSVGVLICVILIVLVIRQGHINSVEIKNQIKEIKESEYGTPEEQIKQRIKEIEDNNKQNLENQKK